MITEELLQIDEKGLEHASKKELLEILSLTERWSSDKDCKFYLYTPYDVPKMFHMSKAYTRACFGGNRSSKTYSHIEDYAMQFVGEAPKALEGLIPEHRLDQKRRLRFCMEDYPNAFSKVVYPYIQQLIPSDKINDVVKDSGRIRAITNAKGGFLEFMYYDQETMKHAGSSRHSIGYDEQPPEAIREQGLMRLADVDGEETFSLTPEAGAMHYLYDDIYLKRGREIEKNYDLIFNEKGIITDAIEGNLVERHIPGGDPDVDVFFACIFDNKSIKKSAAIRILSKFTKDEVLLRAKGHFIFLSGLVYKEYNDTIHLIDPFEDWYQKETRDNYKLLIAIDPHPRTPHAVLFMIWRSDGMLFIVDEIFSPCTAPELVQKIKDKCRGVTPILILIDPIASTPDPSTKNCLLLDLANYGLHNPYPIPASKDRERGEIACQKRLKVNNKGIPGIYITSNCQRFRYEITRYSWDEWKVDRNNTKGEKQKPVDKDDHMMENWYRLENAYNTWFESYEEYDEWEEKIKSPIMRGRNRATGY